MAPTDKTFFIHHYEASPYAEKIRAMFGLTGHGWGSVLSPPYPPRPNVDPLAGGYRRIPVAQLGADIFCDTALIASEVAEFTGHPELAPQVADPDAVALVQRAEGKVFFAAITSVPPLKLLSKLLVTNGPFGTLKFIRDRTGMMQGSSIRPPQGKAAAQLLDEFLADLDAHLAGREAVDREQLAYADFCIYHPIWLALSVGGGRTLPKYANVHRWLTGMEDLGHGSRADMSPEDAFAEAERFAPRDLPVDGAAHDALGKEVTIAPADYGRIGVSGTLAACHDDRYIVARDTQQFGTVHVHFPRDGYELTV